MPPTLGENIPGVWRQGLPIKALWTIAKARRSYQNLRKRQQGELAEREKKTIGGGTGRECTRRMQGMRLLAPKEGFLQRRNEKRTMQGVL
jgi:hypothetical protein